jgi:hypothetical protein
MPYEIPLMFNAQVRNVLPTADHTGLCLGLQIVGLEASEDGRQTLSRLAQVVERYHQINQSDGRVPQTTIQADVTLYETPELEILPNQKDQSRFGSIRDLVQDVRLHGYYGGIRLL